MPSGGRSPEESRRLQELLETAKQYAREHYRGPEAIKVNTEILDIDPDQVGSYTRRGTCYLVAGNLDDAEDDFLDSLDLDPHNRIAINRLKDIEEARVRLEEPSDTEDVKELVAQLVREYFASKTTSGSSTSSSVRSREHHSVYVVELDPAVLREQRFRDANPDYDSTKPCVYVGLTGLTPEERFENHMNGYRSSRIVHIYGVRLLPDLYTHLNPMRYKEAVDMEIELAEDLRDEGYAVWSN